MGNEDSTMAQKSENAKKEAPLEADPANDDEKWPEDAPDDEPESKDNGDTISIRIAPTTSNTKDRHNIVLELIAPPTQRVPVDVCAVIDVSGSMGTSGAVQEDDGTVKKDDGLSVLDLVKHSVKTVMHCLGDKDRLSIVPFSGDAQIHHPLSYMTEDGIKKAEAALDRLSPTGTTNIWEGLRVGMESLRTKKQDGRLCVVMLLTDGQPMMKPEKGEVHELQNYCDTHSFAVQINTFGFGYDLDSVLLRDLAVYGSGTFAFIPDANILGTTFVNSISNVLTTLSPQSTMKLSPVNGAKFLGKTLGGYKEQDESWGKIIEFGPINAGGTRYISVPMSFGKDEEKPYLECVFEASGKKVTVVATQRTVANDLLAGHLTAKAVSVGLEATELATKHQLGHAHKLIEPLKAEVKAAADVASKSDTDDFNQMSANSRLEALNSDVNGRYNKAYQGQPRFNRWGKHYLRALLRAHSVNLCTNFMDPGLQVNGGDLFRILRAKGDEVFVNLPAPKPSRQTGPTMPAYNYQPPPQQVPQRQQAPPRQVYRAPSPPSIDMNDYYGGCGGGCFAPYCMVEVMDPDTKQWMNRQVCAVRTGDVVKVADGCATVVFAVQLARDAQRRMMRFEGGLVVTGGHPIRRNGIWCRPREQSDAQVHEGCDTVITFVLDTSHVLIVNGMECITWGHGMKEEVVHDPFYGTEKVTEMLKRGVIGNGGFGERDIVIM
eukprot:639417_1